MSTMIYNVTAVLMDPAHTVLPNAYVVVDGHKITDFGAQRPQGFTGKCIDGKGGILMPGLVNAHTHVPMTAMRGYGDGNNLQDWLHNFIFPVEAKWDDRAIRACAALGLAEMIASGVTCIADMYMHTDAVLREVESAGISANVSCGGVQFEEPFDPDKNHDCIVQRALTEKWHGRDDGRIQVDASIHGEYTSHAGLWDWMARYAADHGLGMHVHLSETQAEHEQCKARHGGKSPAAVLAEHGVFDVRAIAAHCVWTTEEDWAILARKGVSAIHNPMSNLKLGSGVAPVVDLKKAGVNVALGTDGVSSNNCTDFFGDMKLAAILQNGVRHDPLALTAWDALEMATVNGGKALGRKTGRIEKGYEADLILLDSEALNLIPCHDAANNLAYAAHGSNVVMNMARGKVIYKNGEFLTIDIEKVKKEVAGYALPLLFGR
ncbi:amidohydrolase [Intestinimonas aquisgranensis]|uniref:amidohydrolase family protein n=1 Tax=Intestinimonas timonensis TaxID=1689270 RepID=UPI001D0F49D1|nr:amidohydrolase [Intestinimonas aquisgranensis]